jgi:hypothetical protein
VASLLGSRCVVVVVLEVQTSVFRFP